MKNTALSPMQPLFSARAGAIVARGARWSVFILAMWVEARADIPVIRGALAPTIEVNEEYDSNINANSFGLSDWHTVLTPGATFVRDAGLLRIESKAGVNFQRFSRYDSENSNDPFIQAGAKWTEDESNLDATLNAYLRRFREADVDVNTRSHVEERGIAGYFGQFPTEKLGYRIKGDWHDRNYLLPGWSDVRVQGIGGEGRFHYSPKLDAFVGLGERWNDTYHITGSFPPMDSKDVNGSIGIDGEILPKLSGRVAVGWVRREFALPVGGRQSGATFDTSLLWRPDDEMSVRLLVNRDLDTTPVDQSVMRQVTGIEVHRTFREKLNMNLGLSYALSNYIGVGVSRRDKTYSVQLGADYLLTKNLKAGLHVGYADAQSNMAASDYNRFVGGANFAVLF